MPPTPNRLAVFEKSFEYDGKATCAADGMCQEKCPVKINTGDLIKQLRSQVGGRGTGAWPWSGGRADCRVAWLPKSAIPAPRRAGPVA
jgi:L-lactate utilization protein LutB